MCSAECVAVNCWSRIAMVAALSACGTETPRPDEARARPAISNAPTVATTSYPTTVNVPAKLTSVETSAKDPLGRPVRVACVTCHSQRTTQTLPDSPSELREFHEGLTFRHGSLTCASCHVPGRVDRLSMANGKTIDMTEVLDLCSQCHGNKRKSFDHGAHGGMLGYWDTSRGPRVRHNCVDCHDPHAPAFVGGMPVKGPRDRGFGEGAGH